MSTSVDLRCPVDPRTLFAKVRLGRDAHVVEGNLIEVACDACKRSRRRLGEPVVIVLHRFNVLGQCVDSEVIEHG